MIHLILGHFGYVFSAGFAQFGYSLRAEGFPVTIWPTPQDIASINSGIWDTLKRDPFAKQCLVGYSLGGNACAWLGSQSGPILELVVAFDPTRNGPPLSNYRMGQRVRRAICFKGSGWGPTSWLAGGGEIVFAPTPQLNERKVEVIETHLDHLAVQFSPNLRSICRKALHEVYG